MLAIRTLFAQIRFGLSKPVAEAIKRTLFFVM